MTLEPTRRRALKVALGGLVASSIAATGHPASAAPRRKKSLPEYQAHYRALFKACGSDLDMKVLVGKQLLDNYDRDARVFHAPDRAAAVRMHTALVRQQHARRTSAKS
ncbi:hypothetical protein [Streptomyces sp. NPDC091416]|uniref:hypothetical protein n=1 Tax=Streptomyces sp. NPDC091416 TaxID=3366003 RepID=UPI0038197873